MARKKHAKTNNGQ